MGCLTKIEKKQSLFNHLKRVLQSNFSYSEYLPSEKILNYFGNK